jgi:hypothetical protein
MGWDLLFSSRIIIDRTLSLVDKDIYHYICNYEIDDSKWLLDEIRFDIRGRLEEKQLG